MKVLSFGEILWDVYPDKQCIGGAPLNFAAHIVKQGGESYMLSALGKDALGLSALEKLSARGVNAKYVSVLNDRPTGCCMVTLDEQSVPSYNLLTDVAYDHIPFQPISDVFDLLYFGTLALRSDENLAVLQRVIRENRFSEIIADVNIRAPFSSKAAVQFAIQNATIAKISEEELPVVTEFLDFPQGMDYAAFSTELAKRYRQLKCIIITRGADGAFAMDCTTGETHVCPAVKSKVVSTVGAGDSFAAAFVYRFLQKGAIPSCLRFASQVAGYVVSQYDAVPDYPTNGFEE